MKITNWDKWQTFRKDRGTPPWIKVYRNLLSNEQWVSLTDTEKGHLVSIWILAADKNGSIPDEPKMIKRMAMLDSNPNINKFIELGFLSTTCQPTGNHELDSCPQHDTPEESRDRVEKSRGEKSKPIPAFSKPTHDEINKYAFDKKLNLEGFFDYYESNGWKVGKNPMKNWEAAGRNWHKNQNSFRSQQKEPDFDDTSTQWAEDVITGKTNFLFGGSNENNS